MKYEIYQKYKRTLDSIKREDDKLLKKLINTDEMSLKIADSMTSIFFNTGSKLLKTNRRFRDVVDMKKMFSFIAILYFDCSHQETADYIGMDRTSTNHYCHFIIDRIFAEKKFRTEVFDFLGEEEVLQMIEKFNNKKRK